MMWKRKKEKRIISYCLFDRWGGGEFHAIMCVIVNVLFLGSGQREEVTSAPFAALQLLCSGNQGTDWGSNLKLRALVC